MRYILIIISLCLLCSMNRAATIYVPDHYATIQDAISASVNGDTVVVRPGTYVENIDFLGREIHLKSEAGPSKTVIDGKRFGSVVVFQSFETPAAVLDGFTLTNGSGDYTLTDFLFAGGGVLCDQSSPTVCNNVICGNISRNDGGGIYCSSLSAPVITDNDIVDNSANTGRGGGIACYKADPKIVRNVIRHNTARHMSGGGIDCSLSDGLIHGNVIRGNLCNSFGGGLHCSGGAITISSNIITANVSMGVGGGISSAFSSAAPIISGNLIDGNMAADHGGGIDCQESAFPRIVNNTIVSNACGISGGGIRSGGGCDTSIANTILWDNRAASGPELAVGGFKKRLSTMTISYSDVKGGQASVSVASGSVLTWGAGMIDRDPSFVDPAGNDCHLEWSSPCRNTGDSSAVTETHDFEGDPRIAFGTVDMGADEFHHHLYCDDDVSPGSGLEIKVIGAPGSPAFLALGSGIQDPPIPTPYGDLRLTLPLAKSWKLGAIPGTGVLVHTGSAPSSWVAGTHVPFQALVGPWGGASSKLTNLMLLDVDFHHPPLVVVPDDKPTIQEAIEHVADDGVVVVKPGTYVENIDFEGKAITVMSKQGPAVTIIDGNQAGSVVTFRSFEDERSVLKGFTIANGSAEYGGGVDCQVFTSPTISDNIITGNGADLGGGISCNSFSSPTIKGNTIIGNSATDEGGGIMCGGCRATISNNTISDNSAEHGGGIYLFKSIARITNSTITHNSALKKGGGIKCYHRSSLTIANTILWRNTATDGPQLSLGISWYPCTVSIDYSDIEGGQASVHNEPGNVLNWGAGMIDSDPLFVAGPLGAFYLSQTVAGQAQNSPCVDAGDPASAMIDGTTRTDQIQDAGVVDMGYHNPLP